MSSLHNTTVNIGSDVSKIRHHIGSRVSYLDEQEVLLYRKTTIDRSEPILFLGNDLEQTIKSKKYEITLYGILPCGSKTTLIIEGIRPYVEIKCSISESKSRAIVDDILATIDVDDAEVCVVKGRDFMGYRHHESSFLKISFFTLKDRDEFMKQCKKRRVKTYSNDTSSLYRMAARDYNLNLCNWSQINVYRQIHGSSIYQTHYVFRCDVSDMVAIDPDTYTGSVPKDTLRYDKTIVSSFDIEMCPEIQGAFPDADENVNDTIFMVAQTFHLCKHTSSLLNVVISIKDSAPIEDAIIIVVADERTLLLAFAEVYNLMQPDYVTEFNGGGFDWRNMMTKIVHYGILTDFISRTSIRRHERWEFDGLNSIDYKTISSAHSVVKGFVRAPRGSSRLMGLKGIGRLSRFYDLKEIKIGGSSGDAKYLAFSVPGFIEFDTMIVQKQLEPNAESHTLNECLSRNDLGSKDELPTQKMFDIYLNGDREQMKLVSHYCLVDTIKLQHLLVKQSVVQDKREVCTLAYTSILDGFLYANGMKVRNLIMSRAKHYGLKFDTTLRAKAPCGLETCSSRGSGCYYSERTSKKCEDVKYPGAYVVPPTKGVVAPMLRLDEYLMKNASDDLQCNDLSTAFKFIEDNYDDIYSDRYVDAFSETVNADEYAPIRVFTHDDFEGYGLDHDSESAVLQYIEFAQKNENRYPISGLDFSSLYPSIIMTYNLSPEYMIRDKEYAAELEAKGVPLKYVSFPFGGEKMEAWFVSHGNDPDQFGICARVLIELFNARNKLKGILEPFKDRKKELEMMMHEQGSRFKDTDEYNAVCFNEKYYDSKQKALKVFMNTFYGQMGNLMSFVCAVEVAGSVTTLGRYNLMLAKKFVETEFKVRTYYGDSVIGSTPMYLKMRGKSTVCSVESIVPHCMFSKTNENKELYVCNDEPIYVYSEMGFIKVKKVIRHRTNKKLYRVSTDQGYVVVTEDHSMLSAAGDVLNPDECSVGTNLLTCNVHEMDTSSDGYQSLSEMTQEMNLSVGVIDSKYYWHGLFYAFGRIVDGKCLQFQIPEYVIHSIPAAVLSDKSIVVKGDGIFVHYFPDCEDVDAWESHHYNDSLKKRLPYYLLHCTKDQLLSYMYGAFGHNMIETRNRISFSVYDDVSAQTLYVALLRLNYKLSIEKSDGAAIDLSIHKEIRTTTNDGIVSKIEFVGYTSDYVYDLETETHHFAAGVGNIVVHNTDSLYIACSATIFDEFNRLYFSNKMRKLDYATALVEATFREIERINIGVNTTLMNDNGSKFLKMAYEEVLYPVVFLGKKKYYGTPHVKVVDFYPKKPFIRGVDCVRRGKSEVLKDTCMHIMRGVIDINNVYTVLELVNEAVKRYFSTEWDINNFVKTAVYRPHKNNVSVSKFIQRMLAMKEYVEMHEGRSFPYEIPESNVRFKYAIVKRYPWEYDINGNQVAISASDRWELVDRIKAEDLPIDRNYYFEREITGQLARMIAYDNKFDCYDRSKFSSDMTDDEKLKCIDDAMFKECKKYIDAIASQFSPSYSNKGKLYKSTTKRVKDIVGTISKHQYSKSMQMISAMKSLPSNTVDNLYEYFCNRRATDILKHMLHKSNDADVRECLRTVIDDECDRGTRIEVVNRTLDKYYTECASVLYKDMLSQLGRPKMQIMFGDNKTNYASNKFKSIHRMLNDKLDSFSSYITQNKLEDKIGSLDKSVESMVKVVRQKYDFQKLCDDNVDVDVIDDVVPFQELESLVNDCVPSYSLDADQSNEVLDMILEIDILIDMKYTYQKLKDMTKKMVACARARS